MARALDIVHEREGDAHRVAIRGQLDERADLRPLAADLSGTVRVDLSDLSFVNSIGLRAWIRFLLALSDRDVEVVLTRCSEAMVHQMNMVVAAKAGADVESFYAPYDCPACGHLASMLLEVREHREVFREMRMPVQPCPECEATMESGEIPERYLLFLEL